jgi:hypothetical protein
MAGSTAAIPGSTVISVHASPEGWKPSSHWHDALEPAAKHVP